MDAVGLARALSVEGVDTRRYYAPPVHSTRAYRAGNGFHSLEVTEEAAAKVLSLPLWSSMTDGHVDRVVEAVERLHRFAGEKVIVLPESEAAGDAG